MSEDLKKAELLASERINAEILSAEKKYLQEKERLAKQEAASTESVKRREYIEKLATAKNNLALDKATRNESLRLLKKSNDDYLKELKEAAQKEKEIYKQLKSDILNIYDEILDKTDGSIGSVEAKRLKMEKKLESFGKLSKNVIFRGTGPNDTDEIFTDLIDLSKYTEILERYATNITKVREKMKDGGIKSEHINSLVTAISDLSVEDGLEFTDELLRVNENDFLKYVNSWSKKEEASKVLSAQIYKSEMNDAVDDALNYIKTELENLGLSVPEGFFLSGSISAEKFGAGFVAELTSQLDMIREIIDGFNLSLDVTAKGSGAGDTNTSIYSPTYQINSNGDTVSALSTIKAVETRKVLSGIV